MPELSRADWVREATRTLHEAAVDSPRLSAELILQHVCGISRVELATRPETFLTSDQLSRMTGLLRRLPSRPARILRQGLPGHARHPHSPP